LEIGTVEFDEGEFFAKLRAMSDEELKKFGKSLAFITSGTVSARQHVGDFDWQLREAHAEWRKRYPKK